MKELIYLILLLSIFGLSNKVNAQTSVANGNWTSPTTWGGVPPTPGSTVIINHTVTLDIDYGYSTGSITINAPGTLIKNSPMRALAVSGGTLTVHGILNIPRLALYSGTITNDGTFQNDSLYDATSLTNNSTGTINATQFLVTTGATFNNNGGAVVSTNFLNIATASNSGTMSSYDFMNSKSFTNSTNGQIHATHNFLNSDSLASPGVFTNNGKVTVDNNWRNTDQINGSGKFCIQNLTSNEGAMTGTFDFCDLTGGSIDLNTGSVAGTITYCLFSCSTGINENNNNSFINLYPNPSDGKITIEISKGDDINANQISIYNSIGSLVWQNSNSEALINIDISSFQKGIYFLKVQNKNNIHTEKIIVL